MLAVYVENKNMPSYLITVPVTISRPFLCAARAWCTNSARGSAGWRTHCIKIEVDNSSGDIQYNCKKITK
jgi:hypothetical protein